MIVVTMAAWGYPPVLYSDTTHESPVRADPDDLLLLPGYGFSATDRVIYQAITDTTQPLVRPASIPSSSSALLGLADVVSVADAPYSLAIHLPSVMTPSRSYALWTVNASGWSNGVKINDARPLWLTPDFAYQNAGVAGLPRVLKIVGRNLQPASASAATEVRLSGPRTYTLSAVTDSRTATGATDPVRNPTISRYVAKVPLPMGMPTGGYTIQVSRDGGMSWVALLGENDGRAQVFTVLADPVAAAEFYVSDYGCAPNDGNDDLVCIVNAIHDADAAGGGTVVFGAGVWNLDVPSAYARTNSLPNCLYTPSGTVAPAVTCDGIIVPSNVNLRGAVSARSPTPATISRGPNWGTSGVPTFNLQGNNTVSELYFADRLVYAPWDDPSHNDGVSPGSVLQLGVEFSHAPGGACPVSEGCQGFYNAFAPTTSLAHIVITGNVFDKPYVAISNGSLPIDHLIVTDNVFGGAFSNAIYVMQNANDLWLPFRFDDSIVAFNTFYPSSFYVYANGVYRGGTVPVNTNGPVATQMGTGLRDDFSNNVADGTSVAYFYDETITATNPAGWRAAFFWNTGNNQEMALVSENQALCSGDKAGDGEGISYDNSETLGGLLDDEGHSAAALRVIASAAWTNPKTGNSGSTITVQGALVDPVISAQSTIAASQYYPGQWLQFDQGKGVGQWRKIVSIVRGSNTAGATIAFNIVPASDVSPAKWPPRRGVVTMSPSYWQVVTADNDVDQSKARGCRKLNQNYKSQSGIVRPSPSSGGIGWFASTADSVMEGNNQNNAGGISSYSYFAPAMNGQPGSYAVVTSSNEIRNNVINGEYEWTSAYGEGGILMASGAAATPTYSSASNPTNPPVTAFANTIGGNSVSQAGLSNFNTDSGIPTPMGAIAVTPGINANGPTDSSGRTAWRMNDATLVFHNTLSNLTGGGLDRAGIGIASLMSGVPEAWHSVLYANTCDAVQTDLIDEGTGSVRYCPNDPAGSCECSGTHSVGLSVTASSSRFAAAVGAQVTYVVTVANNDSPWPAAGVALSLEPAAGLEVVRLAISSGAGTCDQSIDVCQLGTLTHGQSTQITVVETGITDGSWFNTFAATHLGPDPSPANSGATLMTDIGPVGVNISADFNVHGIFDDRSAVTDGGLDKHGTAASAELLGASVAWSGVHFALGQADVASAVSNTTLRLPAGNFVSLKLLAAALNGNHPNETFIVSYADGTATSFVQSLSDWRTPQGYVGESKATSMEYKLTMTGAEHSGPYYFYGYTLALDAAKVVKAITLPANRDVVILAVTLVPGV